MTDSGSSRTTWHSGPVRSNSDATDPVKASHDIAGGPSHAKPRAPPTHRSTAPPSSGGYDQRTPPTRGTAEISTDTSRKWLWSYESPSSFSSSSSSPGAHQGVLPGLGGCTGTSGKTLAETSSPSFPLLPAKGSPQPTQIGFGPMMYRFLSRRFRPTRTLALWIVLIFILLIIFHAPLPDSVGLSGLERSSTNKSLVPSPLQQTLGVLRNGVKSSVRQAVNQLPKPSWVSAVTGRASRTSPIKVSMLPQQPRHPTHNPEERYIGFLPHSGFDEQRSAFATALMLGKKLNRTVFVPPVWLAKPSLYKPYVQLQEAWNDELLHRASSFRISGRRGWRSSSDLSLFKPGEYSSMPDEITNNDSKPQERSASEEAVEHMTKCNSSDANCKRSSTTFISWDHLVDLEAVSRVTGVKLVNRWDMREKALEQLLNLPAEEFLVLHDQSFNDLGFLDDLSMMTDTGLFADQSTPALLRSVGSNSDGFGSREVSLRALNKISQKVLLIGSLAGERRLQPVDAAQIIFHRALAFRSSRLIKPARAMRDRLGGHHSYAGVYARFEDTSNDEHVELYLGEAWHDLVARLKVEPSVAEVMWELVRPATWKRSDPEMPSNPISLRKNSRSKKTLLGRPGRSGKRKRPTRVEPNIFEDIESLLPATTSRHRLQRRRSRDDQARLPSLRFTQCRSHIHIDSEYLPFNTPIYLATDSPDPQGDPKLSIFFKAFPCIFIRSDFVEPSEMNGGEVVGSLSDLTRLVNVNDGVALGKLLEPFLDQTVVAMGTITVQAKATLSSPFVERELHAAYRQDLQDEPELKRKDHHGVVFRRW
ncbi:BQ2448_972 [Microbotryum intermedium]|uniref:BQ2448_972 protein n=1 Tax=Microbotryum intermedium TaxID=269621 RepID=A0A238F9R0_9BASI|nr:BQ2448_972 [Microbotryum intermedium]